MSIIHKIILNNIQHKMKLMQFFHMIQQKGFQKEEALLLNKALLSLSQKQKERKLQTCSKQQV